MNFAILRRSFRRRSAFAHFAVLSSLLAGGVWANDQRDNVLFEALLKTSPSPPNWRGLLPEPPPLPDAPLEMVAEYWRFAPDGMAPEAPVVRRLLEWSEEHPADLLQLLRWMPTDSTEFHDRLSGIGERLIEPAKHDGVLEFTSGKIREWLMLHSRYFIGDLIANAKSAFTESEGNGVSIYMEPLSRLDPAAADTLLLDVVGSKESFARAAALVWLHRLHFVEAEETRGTGDPRVRQWRAELQKIAADSDAPMRIRDYAIVGLMRLRWPGQDEWFPGLFGDASLTPTQVGNAQLDPLVAAAILDPERWHPKMKALTAGPKGAAQSNARRCLATLDRKPWVEPGTSLDREGVRALRRSLSLQPVSADEVAGAAREIFRRLRDDDLTEKWVRRALDLRVQLAVETGRLPGLHGFPRGLQAAIAGTQQEIEGLLRGADRGAKIGLLSCARQLPLSLPVTAVTDLLDPKDRVLARAAGAYLQSGDILSGRGQIRHRRGEAGISGAKDESEQFKNAEASLEEMVAQKGRPREILAMLSIPVGSTAWTGRLILIYPDKTIFRQLDGYGRIRERQGPPGEAVPIQEWLARHRADDFPLFELSSSDATQFEYVHVTPGGGRRVYMAQAYWPSGNAFVPYYAGKPAFLPLAYWRLHEQFDTVFKPKMEVIFEALKVFPGFRLLHPREDGFALAMAEEQGKILVALGVRTFDSRGLQEAKWRTLRETGLDQTDVEPPALLREDRGLGRWAGEFAIYQRLFEPSSGRLAGQYVWHGWWRNPPPESGHRAGIWTSDEKSEPKLWFEGSFNGPAVVSSDGEWIAARLSAPTPPAEPFVVIHVADRQQRTIQSPASGRPIPAAVPAQNDLPLPEVSLPLNPLAWLPGQNKFLLREGNSLPDDRIQYSTFNDERAYWLANPVTGETTKTSGEFRPFLHAMLRPLQPVAGTHNYWVALALPRTGPPGTVVGRYDPATFRFQPVLTVPELFFASRDMWVDEAAHHVTFVFEGDVLRLALPPEGHVGR